MSILSKTAAPGPGTLRGEGKGMAVISRDMDFAAENCDRTVCREAWEG